jgi:hypothetical protein
VPGAVQAADLDEPAALKCPRRVLMAVIGPGADGAAVGDPLQNRDLTRRERDAHPLFLSQKPCGDLASGHMPESWPTSRGCSRGTCRQLLFRPSALVRTTRESRQWTHGTPGGTRRRSPRLAPEKVVEGDRAAGSAAELGTLMRGTTTPSRVRPDR